MSPTWPSSLVMPRSLGAVFSYKAPTAGSLRPTAWLDGLRGIAALEVVIYHYSEIWGHIDTGYGSDGPETRTFLRLPLVRALYDSGAAMVCLFFVISGFVLTQRVLRAFRMQEMESGYGFLASSVFRRGLRLFPPAIVAAFCAFLLFRFFDIRPYGTHDENLPHLSNLFRQFLHFLAESVRYVNVFELNLRDGFTFDHGTLRFLGHTYANVTWTIPVEFYGSMACYLQLLGTARCRSKTRNWIIFGISIWALLVARWVLFCFNAGILLAEFMAAQSRRTAPQSRTETIVWSCLFVAGIWIAGCPDRGPATHDNPSLGYNTLWSIFPERYLELNFNYTIWSVGGILIAFSASQLTRVRRFLELGFCQYLGKISFSMYLIHIIIRDILGYKLQAALLHHAETYEITTQDSSEQPLSFTEPWMIRYLACIVWFSIMLPVNFILSGLFEKLVDAPLIRLSKWLETRVVSSTDYKPLSQPIELESQSRHESTT